MDNSYRRAFGFNPKAQHLAQRKGLFDPYAYLLDEGNGHFVHRIWPPNAARE
jgi:hypothetical protein